MSVRSLQEHLLTAEGTARFAAQAQRLLRFQQVFETVLPAGLRAQARVANLRQGKLVIHAANGAVAAKLKQLAPRFAELLIKDGAQLTEITVKVQARPPTPAKHKHKPVDPPSIQRKQALTDLMQKLPAESAIGRSIGNLLKTLKER